MSESKRTEGFVYYIAADSDPQRRMYIGSSIRTPQKRKTQHKHATTRSTVAPILQFADWDLRVIEWYDLEGTKEKAIAQLRSYEQRWIDILRADCVNKNNAIGLDEKKRRAYQKKFFASEKGKAAQERNRVKYNASEERKAARKKYNASEERKAAQRKREASEERKAYQKKYRASEEYKAYQKKYRASEEYKAAQKKYHASEEFKAYQKKYKERKRKEKDRNT